MNIIEKIKLNFYPELKSLDMDEKLVKQIISNKNFKQQYKNVIKPFIKELNEYIDVSDDYLKNVFESSINNNAAKYTNFLKKHNYILLNSHIFNNPNFEKIYSIINDNICKENILEIINDGNGDRLIDFINKHGDAKLRDLNPKLFSDKVWNIISNISNDEIILNIPDKDLEILIDQNLLEGYIYTYQNIPESHSELPYSTQKYMLCFSMEFINKIDKNLLGELYTPFLNEDSIKKIYKIVLAGNVEVIQDEFNNYHNLSYLFFKGINQNDINKSYIEVSSDKKRAFLSKYLGIDEYNFQPIEEALEKFNKFHNIPEDFKEKYINLINFINKILNSTDEEIIKVSKNIDANKIDQYKNLVDSFEKDVYVLFKKQFSDDLKDRNRQMINSVPSKKIINEKGNVDVYELNGVPFTMLIHTVADNPRSKNNGEGKKIVEDPSYWNANINANNFISTSLISNKFYRGYFSETSPLIFGFYDIPWYDLKYLNDYDAGTNRDCPADCFEGNNIDYRKFNNNVDELIESTLKRGSYNEVVLKRVDEETNKKIQPNYIVCFDEINDVSIKASQQFNIPICLINTKYYPENLENIEDKIDEEEITEVMHKAR